MLLGARSHQVVHGHDTTLPITLEEMLVHCRSVSRGARRYAWPENFWPPRPASLPRPGCSPLACALLLSPRLAALRRNALAAEPLRRGGLGVSSASQEPPTPPLALRPGYRCFIVGDMPFGSVEVSPEHAVRNAVRLIKEGEVDAVKIEGEPACSALTEKESGSAGGLGGLRLLWVGAAGVQN